MKEFLTVKRNSIPGGGGLPHERNGDDVNLGFWTHLGCSVQNAIIFSRNGLFQACTGTNIIKKLYIFNSFYLLDSCNQSLKWSLLGVKKKGWATPFQGFNSKFLRSIPVPFIWKCPPGILHPCIEHPLPNAKKKQSNKQANKQIEESDYIL